MVTGWLGLPMMLLFCALVGFSAARLGYCWNILEERWPKEYSKPARQPYMEMAERAFGSGGRSEIHLNTVIKCTTYRLLFNLYINIFKYLLLLIFFLFSFQEIHSILRCCVSIWWHHSIHHFDSTDD